MSSESYEQELLEFFFFFLATRFDTNSGQKSDTRKEINFGRRRTNFSGKIVKENIE